MTGAELLAQVREWLADPDDWDGKRRGFSEIDALDGCVLLTAGEAEQVREALRVPWKRATDEALALLGGDQ